MLMKKYTESDSHIVTDRYAAILQTAERLFGEKGFRGVSIDEIARAAGVSKGLVLYHFTSKKALLEHVLRDGITTILTGIDTSIQSGETVRTKLRAVVEVHLSMLNSRPYLLRIAFFEGIFGEEIVGTFSEEILVKIDGLVQEGIAKGEFKPGDSRVAAIMLLGMIIGLTLQATIQQQPLLSVGQMADEITELFYQGLSP
jgi:AcrR family transcriptional regulator